MEADSSNVDLMDTNEYLIDDWDFDFPLFELEDSNDHNPKRTQDGPHDIDIETTGILASVCERPAKQIRRSNVATTDKSSSPLSSSSPPQVLCFMNSSSSPPTDNLDFSNLFDMEQCGSRGMSKREDGPGKRQPQLLKENALAEKKRRQKLNERLIALSALLPGLKKADKVTVLEDAIKHVKQLQERIKQLEQECVKKSRVHIVEDSSSSSISDGNSDGQLSGQMLPQIEASVSNNEILIRIHCEKSEGCLAKILSEMDKLRLDVINTFTLPFGNSTFHITVLAKIDENLCKSMKDVVKNIRLAMVD